MSNKIEVTDWQLQSFVKKLENHLTNGWEVDDTSVAYYNGLKFSVSLVKSSKLLLTEEIQRNEEKAAKENSEIENDNAPSVLGAEEGGQSGTSLEGFINPTEDAEVLSDQVVVETPVKVVVAPKKGAAKAK